MLSFCSNSCPYFAIVYILILMKISFPDNQAFFSSLHEQVHEGVLSFQLTQIIQPLSQGFSLLFLVAQHTDRHHIPWIPRGSQAKLWGIFHLLFKSIFKTKQFRGRVALIFRDCNSKSLIILQSAYWIMEFPFLCIKVWNWVVTSVNLLSFNPPSIFNSIHHLQIVESQCPGEIYVNLT